MALTPSQKQNIINRIAQFEKEILNIETKAQRDIAQKQQEIIRLNTELQKG